MNIVTETILKLLRRLYIKLFVPTRNPLNNCISDPETVNKIIYDRLVSGSPCMVTRYGSTELFCTINYLSIEKGGFPILDYIKNRRWQWWWNRKGLRQLSTNAGFFPLDITLVEKFCRLIIKNSQEIDILGHWLNEEEQMSSYLKKNVTKVNILMMEPYWSIHPWTKALEGKKVLVVHPFANLIEKQYANNRIVLFSNPDVLPYFHLRTVKAVQSIGGSCNQFNNWFEALEWMKKEMDKEPYDIALIGCGAYGMPLAAYSKQTGHQAIHLAGALQLLFGIRGKRWDDPNFGIQEFGVQNKYKELFNDKWVYPDDSCKPKTYRNVEGGCYW